MEIYGNTNIGKVRASNQDNFVFRKLDEDCLYAIVCDGMGGHNGGNVASELAVRNLDSTLSAGYDEFIRNRSIENLLRNAISHANGTVFSVSLKDEGLKGMGTTLVMTYVLDSKAYIAHVGDSRAYLYDGDNLTQLTVDHSIVQEMIDKGDITEEEAKIHPYRHVITRVLGFTSDVEIDIQSIDLAPTDIILMCSDGLSNMLTTQEIERVLETTSAPKVCDELIKLANKRGGLDNITVCIVCGDKAE